MNRFWLTFAAIGMVSCTAPEMKTPPTESDLAYLEARASLHDSWAVANAQMNPKSKEAVAASTKARLAVIRSRAVHHEMIDGNEVMYSAREDKADEIVLSDCILSNSTSHTHLASESCVIKDHRFTFSGKPVQWIGGN